jgi:LPXTG-motif cell wall-anchored protein
MSTGEKILWISLAGAGITAAAFYVMYRKNKVIADVEVPLRDYRINVLTNPTITPDLINRFNAVESNNFIKKY